MTVLGRVAPRIGAARGGAWAGIVGGMLKPGDKAPDFTLPDQDGNEFSLSKAGTKVLVYFYP
jgi:peroxiredoxin